MSLKILSWNIWFDSNLNNVNTFLENINADIIGLQEVMRKDNKIQLSDSLFKEYQFVYAPAFQITKNGKTVDVGNAILSRYPILEYKIHNLSQTDNRIAIEATIKVNNKILQVVCTHLVHTHQQASQIQDIQAENLVKILSETNSILVGDFNALPESNAVKTISKILRNTDSKLLPTWSVYPEGCNSCLPLKIIYKLDNIFVSKNLKTSSYQVEASDASDHLPISIIIEI
ncbi:MAG TPA: endonuclease/exonuclease/phosphatase family protein [Candidatus Sulfotelmatobacter sp.]|nr:endonuclease/exonuclease/phosphatase family protein [Candidatus Sulfotelmatobacter sp.]